MKNFMLLVVACFVLSSGNSFAEGLSNSTTPNGSTQSTNNSAYKSSPRLDYHSNKPAKSEKGSGGKQPGTTPGIGGFASPNSSKDSSGSTGNDRRNF